MHCWMPWRIPPTERLVEVPEIRRFHSGFAVRHAARFRSWAVALPSRNQNYQSACTWDICSLQVADEKVEA